MKQISCVAVAMFLATLAPTRLSAQDSHSGPLARELTQLMASQKLGAVAARDPDTSDRFVAALMFPEVQLLVVTARYAAPSVLQERLAKKEYADIYATLQQAPIQDSKVFFQDLKADGLHAKPGAAVDVMYQRVVEQSIFDGNPAKQKVSEAAYAEKFAAADVVYSRLLTLLIGELKGAASTH